MLTRTDTCNSCIFDSPVFDVLDSFLDVITESTDVPQGQGGQKAPQPEPECALERLSQEISDGMNAALDLFYGVVQEQEQEQHAEEVQLEGFENATPHQIKMAFKLAAGTLIKRQKKNYGRRMSA